MKTILNALILMSLSLSCNFALSAEADEFPTSTPKDVIANPPANNPANDADVKGTITPPTTEQKENVAKPVKKAHAKKAKATHKHHAKKAKKKKAKRSTSSENASGTIEASAASTTAKKAKKKTKRESHARHPHLKQ